MEEKTGHKVSTFPIGSNGTVRVFSCKSCGNRAEERSDGSLRFELDGACPGVWEVRK